MATVTDRQPLTKRQQKIFEFVWRFRQEHGYCVSVREIMQQFDISSPNGVVCHLKALRRKNWVVWDPRTPRTIRPVEETEDAKEQLPTRDQLRKAWETMHEAHHAEQ